jgi:TnpA family transposase
MPRRLQILTEQEFAAMYAIPLFTDTTRRHFFALPEIALTLLNLKPINGKETSAKLYFILQFGYFKAKHLFCSFQYHEVEEDVKFIMETYLPHDSVPKKLPTRKVQAKIKNNISELQNISINLKAVDKLITEKTNSIVRMTNQPVIIFHEIVTLLEQNKLMLPRYSRLQDKIGAALKNENNRILSLIKEFLTPAVEEAMQKLYSTDLAFYNITELKFDAKSFQTQEIQGELNKLALCQILYDFSQKVLPKLGISRKNMEHYSELAKTYTVYRLTRILKAQACLYLICYVQQRYERIVNNLIQGFIYYVDKYTVEAKKYAENNKAGHEMQFTEQHKKLVGTLIRFYADDEVMQLPGPLIREKAYQVMEKATILTVSQALLEEETDKTMPLIWEFHKNNYRSILLNLRPLFRALDFKNEVNVDLTRAIHFFKDLLQQNKKLSAVDFEKIPIRHITPKKILPYFFETNEGPKRKADKVLNIYQYEFYLYRAIRESLKNGRTFINNSVEYKSFSEDVKVYPNWHNDKQKILLGLNNKILTRPIEDTLAELETILEPLIQRVNQRALSGENKRIKLVHHRDGTTSWTIPYPKKNNESDNPFYGNLEQMTISEVFDFVEQKCGFMKAFTHIKPHYAKSKKDYLGIKATILANATTQGIYQFAKRSNLKYQRLLTAEQNYVRLETLRHAADRVINFLIELPLFRAYHLNDKQHGSVDGTKKKTKRRLLKARHSPKYFGLDIGVVIMTMNLNHLPLVTNIIGANEHESHYTFSMLMQNMTAIDPNIISTDTAGTNNINDFLYYLIGKIHAACYRSTPDKAETISGFHSAEHYKECLIKPDRRVPKELIKTKWPDIQPILAALLSRETKQSIVVKKLSSHDYKNEMKEALWELNNILKSIHLLKYIDDPDYCRYVRMALNRGEAYHQLLDKIMGVGSGDFRGMSDLEVEIWSECTRLVALIIIFYNTYLLSELYELKFNEGDKAAIEFLKHISPIASQHFNIICLKEMPARSCIEADKWRNQCAENFCNFFAFSGWCANFFAVAKASFFRILLMWRAVRALPVRKEAINGPISLGAGRGARCKKER